MMSRRAIITTIAVLALAVAGFAAWKFLFPDDKTRIVRTLDAAADAVGIEQRDAGVIVKSHRLEALVDDRIDLSLRINREDYERTIERRELLAILAAERRAGSRLKVGISDIAVTVDGDRAHAEATVSVSYKNGDRESSPQEDVSVELVRRDGKWLISRVRLRTFMEK